MKPKTARLLQKAEHALRVAELAVNADENDSAANRAYYAMFVSVQVGAERARRERVG